MGTKNNPGQFDCYAKADPDEPIFTFRANDALSPHFVAMYQFLRTGELTAAIGAFHAAVEVAGERPSVAVEDPKMVEAYKCACDMDTWRMRNK